MKKSQMIVICLRISPCLATVPMNITNQRWKRTKWNDEEKTIEKEVLKSSDSSTEKKTTKNQD